jgi:hypothetical protein
VPTYPMAGSDLVADAIRNAAMRAERHALLNSAVTSMEELLNFPLPPEQLPWGLAMSKSYFFAHSKMRKPSFIS